MQAGNIMLNVIFTDVPTVTATTHPSCHSSESTGLDLVHNHLPEAGSLHEVDVMEVRAAASSCNLQRDPSASISIFSW